MKAVPGGVLRSVKPGGVGWLAKIALVSALPDGAQIAFVSGPVVLLLVTLQLIPLGALALWGHGVREEG